MAVAEVDVISSLVFLFFILLVNSVALVRMIVLEFLQLIEPIVDRGHLT